MSRGRGWSAKGPNQHGTGRQCRCGTILSRYTKGDKCNPCKRRDQDGNYR